MSVKALGVRWVSRFSLGSAVYLTLVAVVSYFFLIQLWDLDVFGSQRYNQDWRLLTGRASIPLALIAAYLVVIALPARLRAHFEGVRTHEETLYVPLDNPVVDAIVRGLRHRAGRLRVEARLVLLLIIIAVGAGIYVFAVAERLNRSPLARVADSLAQIDGTMGSIANEVRPYAAQVDPDTIVATAPVTPPSPESRLEKAAQDIRQTITEQRTQIGAVEELISQNAGNYTASVLISTMSTRVGIILLLLFLVQILVTLYRYNMRMSSHLEGRAVALQLSVLQLDGDTKQRWQIGELVGLFGGDNVDFGKLPPTAVQSFTELARQITQATRRTPSTVGGNTNGSGGNSV